MNDAEFLSSLSKLPLRAAVSEYNARRLARREDLVSQKDFEKLLAASAPSEPVVASPPEPEAPESEPAEPTLDSGAPKGPLRGDQWAPPGYVPGSKVRWSPEEIQYVRDRAGAPIRDLYEGLLELGYVRTLYGLRKQLPRLGLPIVDDTFFADGYPMRFPPPRETKTEATPASIEAPAPSDVLVEVVWETGTEPDPATELPPAPEERESTIEELIRNLSGAYSAQEIHTHLLRKGFSLTYSEVYGKVRELRKRKVAPPIVPPPPDPIPETPRAPEPIPEEPKAVALVEVSPPAPGAIDSELRLLIDLLPAEYQFDVEKWREILMRHAARILRAAILVSDDDPRAFRNALRQITREGEE